MPVNYNLIDKSKGINATYNETVPVIDSDWVRSVFLTPGNVQDADVQKSRYVNSAVGKFTDTQIGGNTTINNKTQFNRYSDVRVPGRRSDRKPVNVKNITGNHGMGRYYSEAIDDNKQSLYLTFGVPKFKSLFSFFARAIDYGDAVVANTGRTPYLYYAGYTVGTVGAMYAFPVVSTIMYLAKFLGFVKDILIGASDMRYYTLREDMMHYWSTVNSLVTVMATEIGFVQPVFGDPDLNNKIGLPVKTDQAELKELRKLLPDVLKDSNYVDVYAIALRGQLMMDRALKEEVKLLKKENMSKEEFVKHHEKKIEKPTGQSYKNYYDKVVKIFKEEAKDKEKKPPESSNENNDTLKEDVKRQPDGTLKLLPGEKEADKEYSAGVYEYFTASRHEGYRFVTFGVEYVGAVTESFSNSTKDIQTAGMLNSMGGAVRDIRFSLAGGNISGTPLDNMMKGAVDFLAGGAAGLTFGLSNVLMGLLQGGFIEMPKMWDDSSMSLPTVNYKMNLTAMYNNPISLLLKQYIPLCMLLAGMLPKSVGGSSYASPFLCSSFLRGVQDISLGMITECSITRGTTNLGFNKAGKSLGMEVSFTITDFATIMSAPVDSGILGAFNLSLDDNRLINRYLATLSGRDLRTSKYNIPKAKLRLARAGMGASVAMSSAYWGMMANDTFSFWGAFNTGNPAVSLNTLSQ